MWPRREHYSFFRQFGVPFVSITSRVDVAPLRGALKREQIPFTIGLLYLVARAVNDVPELRQRIREKGPIEHAMVHPGITVLAEDDTFHFGICPYDRRFGFFAEGATRGIETARTATSLIPDAFSDI